MRCKIQNTGKIPVKNKYGKIPYKKYTVYCGPFLQIFFRVYCDLSMSKMASQ